MRPISVRALHEVLVVFADRPDSLWLRALAPGFRHCFAALRVPDAWLLLDPLKGHIELAHLQPPAAFDLPRFYVAQGHRVLRGRQLRSLGHKVRLPRPLTCVEVVKRVIGVDAPTVLTPRQLHRHLLGHDEACFEPILGY